MKLYMCTHAVDGAHRISALSLTRICVSMMNWTCKQYDDGKWYGLKCAVGRGENHFFFRKTFALWSYRRAEQSTAIDGWVIFTTPRWFGGRCGKRSHSYGSSLKCALLHTQLQLLFCYTYFWVYRDVWWFAAARSRWNWSRDMLESYSRSRIRPRQGPWLGAFAITRRCFNYRCLMVALIQCKCMLLQEIMYGVRLSGRPFGWYGQRQTTRKGCINMPFGIQ